MKIPSHFFERDPYKIIQNHGNLKAPRPEIRFYLKGLAMVALKGAPLDSHDPSVFESYQIIAYKFIRTLNTWLITGIKQLKNHV